MYIRSDATKKRGINMANEVNNVAVTVQWKEGNSIQKRTLYVAEGTVVDAEKSGKFTAKKGNKIPVWNMDKGDAYVLLGASHADEDKSKDPKYKLDKQDMKVLKAEWNNSFSDTENGKLQQNTAVRSGTGAGGISSAFFNTNGEYVVNHGTQNNRISIFIK